MLRHIMLQHFTQANEMLDVLSDKIFRSSVLYVICTMDQSRQCSVIDDVFFIRCSHLDCCVIELNAGLSVGRKTGVGTGEVNYKPLLLE